MKANRNEKIERNFNVSAQYDHELNKIVGYAFSVESLTRMIKLKPKDIKDIIIKLVGGTPETSRTFKDLKENQPELFEDTKIDEQSIQQIDLLKP